MPISPPFSWQLRASLPRRSLCGGLKILPQKEAATYTRGEAYTQHLVKLQYRPSSHYSNRKKDNVIQFELLCESVKSLSGEGHLFVHIPMRKGIIKLKFVVEGSWPTKGLQSLVFLPIIWYNVASESFINGIGVRSARTWWWKYN